MMTASATTHSGAHEVFRSPLTSVDLAGFFSGWLVEISLCETVKRDGALFSPVVSGGQNSVSRLLRRPLAETRFVGTRDGALAWFR